MKSARFKAGHFFRKAIGLPLLLIIAPGCGGSEPPARRGDIALQAGETAVLVHFQGMDGAESMPEAVYGLDNTASGRFHVPSDHPGDPLLKLAEAADENGLLLLLVLDQNQTFTGTRDHLIVWTDSTGLPVRVEPETGSELFSDSLWTDPRTRQNTILQLITLFKPDLVLQQSGSSGGIVETIRFWGEAGEESGVTACFYSMPDLTEGRRGWGVFTGRGVTDDIIEGMYPEDFQATIYLLAGLEWQGIGYPALQAFTLSEDQ